MSLLAPALQSFHPSHLPPFSQFLLVLRQSHGLTLAGAARRVRVSPGLLAEAEAGDRLSYAALPLAEMEVSFFLLPGTLTENLHT